MSALEDLSLNVYLDFPPPNLSEPAYQEVLDGWKSFDILITQSKFSRLSRVRIDFLLDNPLEDQLVPEIVEDIVSQLPGLDQSGLLYVDSCELR